MLIHVVTVRNIVLSLLFSTNILILFFNPVSINKGNKKYEVKNVDKKIYLVVRWINPGVPFHKILTPPLETKTQNNFHENFMKFLWEVSSQIINTSNTKNSFELRLDKTYMFPLLTQQGERIFYFSNIILLRLQRDT